MPKFLRFLLGLVGGFAAGAVIGGVLVSVLSPNTHDKSLEIAMTALFVAGPIGAVIGIAAALISMRKPTAS